MGHMLGAEHGWGESALGDAVYYTPQLRHVEIDRNVAEAAGKQFVYGWFGSDQPVMPIRASPSVHLGARRPAAVRHVEPDQLVLGLPLNTEGHFFPTSVAPGDTERERDDDMRDALEQY